MRTVSVRLSDLERAVVPIGFVGENQHTQVRIDCLKLYEEYPHAAASLTVKPPKGDSYPAVVVRDGNTVVWEITDSDLIYDGNGEIQLSFTVDEVVAKSYVGRIKISRSITPTGEVPEPLDDFLTRAGAALTAIPETIAVALQEAKDSGEFDGYSPTVVVTEIIGGHQVTVTDVNGDHVFLVMDGVDGDPGTPGFSPSASVSKVGKKATISITDKDGTTTAEVNDGEDGQDGQDGHSPVVTASKSGKVTTVSVDGTAIATINDGNDGQDGDPGATPVISIGTVSTLTPGSDATASMDTTDPAHPVLSLGIPEGEPGNATIDDTSVANNRVWSAQKVNDLKSALVSLDKGYINIQTTLISDKYISNANGELINYNGWDATEKIPVSSGELFYIDNTTDSIYNAFYDENMQFITNIHIAVGTKQTILIPANVAYMALSNVRNAYSNLCKDSTLKKDVDSKIDDIASGLTTTGGKIDINTTLLRATWIDINNNCQIKSDPSESAYFKVLRNHIYTWEATNNNRDYVAFYDNVPTIGATSYNSQYLVATPGTTFVAPIDGYCVVYYNASSSDTIASTFNAYLINSDNEFDMNSNALKGLYYAHRCGCFSLKNTIPENSLVGVKWSAENGFAGVESDIQVTSDGYVVMSHDATINRIARNSDGSEIQNTITISNSTLEQLRQYDFGIYKGQEYAGTKIPTIEDMIRSCKINKMILYLDTTSFSGAIDANIAQKIYNALIKHNYIYNTIIEGTTQNLKNLIKYINDSRLSYVVTNCNTITNTDNAIGFLYGCSHSVFASRQNPYYKQTDSNLIENGHAKDVLSIVFTLSNSPDVNEALNRGADIILLDNLLTSEIS